MRIDGELVGIVACVLIIVALFEGEQHRPWSWVFAVGVLIAVVMTVGEMMRRRERSR